jgi:hypothetical protein
VDPAGPAGGPEVRGAPVVDRARPTAVDRAADRMADLADLAEHPADLMEGRADRRVDPEGPEVQADRKADPEGPGVQADRKADRADPEVRADRTVAPEGRREDAVDQAGPEALVALAGRLLRAAPEGLEVREGHRAEADPRHLEDLRAHRRHPSGRGRRRPCTPGS